MDAIVQRDGVYEPVGFGGAFRRQFGLLWQSRRPLLSLIGLLAVLALAGEPWNQDLLARLLTAGPIWLIFAGPVWAFSVFHNEGPSNRLYHWSQPVRRDLHTMARLTAGAAWLVIMYAVLAAAGLLMAAIEGTAWQLAAIGFSGWANFFTAPLIGYFAVAVLTVLSDYPLRWFFGLIFLFVATLSLMQQWLGWDRVVEFVFTPLGLAEWGVGRILIIPFMAARERIEGGLLAQQEGASFMSEGFLSTWWVAMPLWIAFFCGLTWVLARRHPDVLPRWHR